LDSRQGAFLIFAGARRLLSGVRGFWRVGCTGSLGFGAELSGTPAGGGPPPLAGPRPMSLPP